MAEVRFCDQCGKSLVPLRGLHTQRPCEVCGKTIHEAEPGEGGRGIRIQEGDRVVLPPESLSISLDAKSSTRFSRHGLAWFVRHLINKPLDRKADDLGSLFEYWEREGETILKRSNRLADLALEDEKDAEKSIDIITQHEGSLEWWALMLIANARRAKERLGEGGNAAEAVLAACRGQAALSMTVYMRDLEEYVWTGYQHSKLIYGIATASAQTPGEAQAIEALKPVFENLSEEVLHAWVDSGADVGPRIGVTEVDEELLKALARFHLSEFERRRKQRQLDREHGSRTWQNRIAGAVAGATLMTAMLGALRAFGVL